MRLVTAAFASMALTLPVSAQPTQPLGWKGEEACNFMAGEINGARSYKLIYDTSWLCSTPYNEIVSIGIGMANNIAYYAIGTKDAVTELRLVVNVNQPKDAARAIERLRSSAEALVKRALSVELRQNISTAISMGTPGSWFIDRYRVVLLKEVWTSGRGYELKFIISAPEG